LKVGRLACWEAAEFGIGNAERKITWKEKTEDWEAEKFIYTISERFF